MEILDAFVNWYEGYKNKPKLHVTVDEIPDENEMIFNNINNNLWYSEKEGFYRYYVGDPNKKGDGLGGMKVELQTEDGIVTLIGPYASRAGVLNSFGIGPCVDARIHEKGTGKESEGSISLEKAKKASEISNFSLKKIELGENDYGVEGEFYYELIKNY